MPFASCSISTPAAIEWGLCYLAGSANYEGRLQFIEPSPRFFDHAQRDLAGVAETLPGAIKHNEAGLTGLDLPPRVAALTPAFARLQGLPSSIASSFSSSLRPIFLRTAAVSESAISAAAASARSKCAADASSLFPPESSISLFWKPDARGNQDRDVCVPPSREVAHEVAGAVPQLKPICYRVGDRSAVLVDAPL